MRTHVVEGGRYGDILPSGAYAVMAEGVMVTHQGPVAYTFGPALYPRITEVGGFQIVGQAATGGGYLHWHDGVWHQGPKPSHGVSGHIFDQSGQVRLAPTSTSQGYRYVAEDGTLVLGDKTYSNPARRIFEWTTYGDLTIGQGAESGCIAIHGSKRYVLEPGHCTFVRFARAGDQLAVCITKQRERRVLLRWLTVAELAMFPREAEPTPTPIPTPEPEPMPDIPNHEDVVAQWREIYSPLPPGSERAFRITNGTAWDLRGEGAGILSKPAGHNFLGFATDIIVYPDGRHFDVLVDGEGDAKPTWRLVTNPPKVDQARWRAPMDPNVTPGPDPEPEPEPGPTPPPPSSGPTYDEGVETARLCAEKWGALHLTPELQGRNLVDAGQMFQWCYRMFREGWSRARILEDVK